jgi:hypothetical protein
MWILVGVWCNATATLLRAGDGNEKGTLQEKIKACK